STDLKLTGSVRSWEHRRQRRSLPPRVSFGSPHIRACTRKRMPADLALRSSARSGCAVCSRAAHRACLDISRREKPHCLQNARFQGGVDECLGAQQSAPDRLLHTRWRESLSLEIVSLVSCLLKCSRV